MCYASTGEKTSVFGLFLGGEQEEKARKIWELCLLFFTHYICTICT